VKCSAYFHGLKFGIDFYPIEPAGPDHAQIAAASGVCCGRLKTMVLSGKELLTKGGLPMHLDTALKGTLSTNRMSNSFSSG